MMISCRFSAFLILPVICLLLFSQTNLQAQTASDSQLEKARLLMMSHPDSALTLIRLIESQNMPDDPDALSKLFSIKGWASRRAGNWQDAALYLEKALEYAEQENNMERLCEIYSCLSYVTIYTISAEKGLNLSKKYLSLAHSLNDSSWIADANDMISQAYRQLGDYQSGEPYVRELLNIRLQQDSMDRRASAHNLMAIYLSETGDFTSAIYHFNRAIQIAKENGLTDRLYSPMAELAWLYHNSNEYDKALEYASQVYDLAFTNNNREWMLGSVNILSLTYRKSGNPKEGIKWLDRSLELLQMYNRPEAEFIVYRDFGFLYKETGEPRKAEQSFQKALQIAKDNPDIYQGYLLNEYSLLKQGLGEQEAALRLVKQSYAESRNTNIDREFESLTTLSQIYYEQGSDSAFYYADEAIKVFDAAIKNESSNITALRLSGLSGFQNKVALWNWEKRKDIEAAFILSEQAKARKLSQDLQKRKLKRLQQEEPELVNRRKDLIRELNLKYAEQAATSSADSLKKVINQLELAKEALDAEMASSYEGELNIPEPYTLKEVQTMLDDQSMIIEFTLSETGLLTFMIQKGTVQVHSPLERALNIEGHLRKLVTQYREQIRSKAPKEELEISSSEILSLLLPDSFFAEQTPENLIIIPDASLHYLPFGALIHEGKYLIEDYCIKMLPSVNTLPLIREPGRIFRNTFFGFANSDFSFAENTQSRRSEALSPLPFARIEVEDISDTFTFAYVSDRSVYKESDLSRRLGNYKFVHFATHGIINEASPDFSKLILNNKLLDNEGFSDGHLTAAEISALDLNADLVVLSACDTGMGKIIRGEGVLGLQRAFLIAGASSVVVSLWEVFDQSTATFMDYYYEELLENYSIQMSFKNRLLAYFDAYEEPLIDYKAKSMRDAKLDMLQHPYYSHPAYWAAFVYTGR